MWNVHTYVYGKLITFSKLQPIIRNIYVRTWYGRKIIFKINNMFLNLLRIKIEREIWHGTSLYKIWLVTEIKYQSFCLYPDKYINISPKQGESKKYNYRVCSGTHVKFTPIKSFYREIIVLFASFFLSIDWWWPSKTYVRTYLYYY